MPTTQVKLQISAEAYLGEGAIWHPVEQQLYWVDIEQKKLHIYNPATDEKKIFTVPARIGTVVPVKSGGALIALQNGIHYIDTTTGILKLIVQPIDAEDIRFNDGKCDPAGRFWVGTMQLNTEKGRAKLYRLNHDLSIDTVLEGLTISNGICWTSDAKTMYLVDTPTQQVYAFDFDNGKGEISNQRVVVSIPAYMGNPDGMTIDSDDNLWVALYDGGAICKYDPATGELLQKVDVPVPVTTSCAFGGADLKTLFITTGQQGLSEEDLKKYPLSGSVFSVECNVAGVDASLFKSSVTL